MIREHPGWHGVALVVTASAAVSAHLQAYLDGAACHHVKIVDGDYVPVSEALVIDMAMRTHYAIVFWYQMEAEAAVSVWARALQAVTGIAVGEILVGSGRRCR